MAGLEVLEIWPLFGELSNPVHPWQKNRVLIQLGLTYRGNLNLDSSLAVRMDYRAILEFTTSTSPSFTQHPQRSILNDFKGFSYGL